MIIATVVGFLILAIILGTIFYLSSNLGKSTPNQVVTSSPLPVSSIPTASQSASPSPSAQASGGTNSAAGQASSIPNTKVYTGGTFAIAYPQNWGLLTCSNSKNIEFDPVNSTDQLNVACSYAQKPITVIVENITSCSGEQMTLGSNQVYKSRTYYTDGVDYEWCIKGTPGLDITHRVSTDNQRATSVDDYSAQIEDMISHIYFVSGS